jgi:Xaa-Pro dipeptidase
VNGVIDAHRPGVTGRQLGQVGDDLIRNLGYGEDLGAAIWDLYGHGLSTFWLGPIIPAFVSDSTPERPTWRVDEPYHEGQVCTVEIFLHTSGVGTATFEQILVVGPTGAELLSTTPMIMF